MYLIIGIGQVAQKRSLRVENRIKELKLWMPARWPGTDEPAYYLYLVTEVLYGPLNH